MGWGGRITCERGGKVRSESRIREWGAKIGKERVGARVSGMREWGERVQ